MMAAHARRLDVDPVRYLENNDSYEFFRRYDALSEEFSHFKTGPTGTNVMDIQIVLLEPASWSRSTEYRDQEVAPTEALSHY